MVILATGLVAILNSALMPKARMSTICYTLVCVTPMDWSTWVLLTFILLGADILVHFNKAL